MKWNHLWAEGEAGLKYVHAHMYAVMTKVISLSEEAYGELKKRKGADESFSDVVLKMAKGKRSDSIMELAGTWKGGDADRVLSEIIKQRHKVKSREFNL